MNKDTIIRLIKNTEIKQDEFTQFILDYIKFKNKPEPTAKQLQGILELLKMGVFNLNEAIEDGIKLHKLQVQRIIKDGIVINIEVYE